MRTQGPKPWKHQLDSLSFAYRRRGSLLWLPMGAGKSRIVVDYVQNDCQGPVLIIAPHKVCPVWPGEFNKYFVGWSEDRILVLDRGTIAQRTKRLREHPRLITVINYDAVFRSPMKNALMEVEWDMIILDECHRIKAPSGVTSKYMSKLAYRKRKIIGLSGTPLSTGRRLPDGTLIGAWQDIFGQARTICPYAFGWKWTEFKNTYGIWMKEPFPKLLKDINQEQFDEKLRSFCFHVKEEDLNLNLPEVVEQTIELELPDPVQKIYKDLEEEYVAEWQGNQLTASNALVKMLRLQQIAGGFIKLNDILEVNDNDQVKKTKGKTLALHTEKVDAISELLEDIAPSEKVVIFCKFTAEVKAIGEIKTDRPKFFLVGGQNTSEDWKTSEGGVLIVQIQAGSEGVDLTAGRYCIYCSSCHSMKDYTQSKKRLHRPGQKRTVFYYYLVTQKTVDVLIYKATQAKIDAVDFLRNRLLGGQ